MANVLSKLAAAGSFVAAKLLEAAAIKLWPALAQEEKENDAGEPDEDVELESVELSEKARQMIAEGFERPGTSNGVLVRGSAAARARSEQGV